MEELKAILIAHAKRYPLMQPTDAVKLVYQNEFGGGHLIRDEQACLNYLRREYDSIVKDPNVLLYEAIGNGIVRVNLAAVKPKILNNWAEILFALLLRTQVQRNGFCKSWMCFASLPQRVISNMA